MSKVSKGAKIRNRYNQVPHPYQWESDKLTVGHLFCTTSKEIITDLTAIQIIVIVFTLYIKHLHLISLKNRNKFPLKPAHM